MAKKRTPVNDPIITMTAVTKQAMDNNEISQTNLNVLSQLINQNFINDWCDGFNSIELKLIKSNNPNSIKYETPNITKEFIARFINGGESIDTFLKQSPKIKIGISNDVFNGFEKPDNVYDFFKSLVSYYSSKVDRAASVLLKDAMELGPNMKHLVSNTELYKVVSLPMTMIFTFDNIDPNNIDKSLVVSNNDMKQISDFMNNMVTSYDAPEDQKDEILKSLDVVINALMEHGNTDMMYEFNNIKHIIECFYKGDYDDQIEIGNEKFIEANIDKSSMQFYKEHRFSVKKLKKIPPNLVSYITAEINALNGYNGKMMLASYCLSKIEIVEWYIELLVVGTKKYLVPHTRRELETLRSQLISCYSRIMDVNKDRNMPMIPIKFPQGYK